MLLCTLSLGPSEEENIFHLQTVMVTFVVAITELLTQP